TNDTVEGRARNRRVELVRRWKGEREVAIVLNALTPAIALLLNLLLLDAAVETFWRGSPVRWVVRAMVVMYAAVLGLTWRRTTWRVRAIGALAAMLAALAV